MTDFNAAVRAAAADKGVSLGKLAEMCGMQRQVLQRTLKINNPQLGTIDRVAAALGLTAVELLSYGEDKPLAP